ncbi:TPA: LysR family transcriptional regulator [Morganella morganii]|nr:LysR family transcriptional regulator [Morganella morganii]
MDRITAAQVFIAITEQRSMSKAADMLGMSRAMVTRYLAEMENWAGVRLLNRTTRSLTLTSAGETVLTQSRELLSLATAIARPVVTEDEAVSGLVRITCAQSLAMVALSKALVLFRARYPAIAVDVQVTNKALSLVEERIDLGIRITNNLEPNLIAKPLSRCDSVVCASPAYLEKHGYPPSPESLSELTCLTYNFYGRSLWLFERDDGVISVPVSGALSANESTFLLEATLNGEGIALQPYCSVYEYLKTGRLVRLFPEYRLPALGIYGIYTSREHMARPLRLLLDFLAEWFAHSPDWLPYLLDEKTNR